MGKRNHVLNWNDCEWTHSRPKIKFVTYQGADTMTATLGQVDPGHEVGPHSHSYEQLVIILQGECNFWVDGKPNYMTAGCIMAVKPYLEHYIEALGDTPVLNLDVFAPKRPEEPDAESDRIGAKIYSKRDYRLESKLADEHTKPEDHAFFELFQKKQK